MKESFLIENCMKNLCKKVEKRWTAEYGEYPETKRMEHTNWWVRGFSWQADFLKGYYSQEIWFEQILEVEYLKYQQKIKKS